MSDHVMSQVIMWGLISGGAALGGLASLVPNKKMGIGLLCAIPIAMIVFIYIELADPSRQGDAMDGLAYIFGSFWPSAGALIGFLVGKKWQGGAR